MKPQFPPGWSQSTLARSKQPMHNSKILFPSKGSCFEILNFELLHMKKKDREREWGENVKQNSSVGEEDNSQSELHGVTQEKYENASTKRGNWQRVVGH